jgi:benzoylformate decarboxylase
VVGMADVYAQLTGEPTLVNLHTAVGLGNAMGAIINAASGHSPLVITAGQQVRSTLTMQPLLANPDPTMLPRPAVKWAFEPPRAQDVPAALARAFRYAALPPAGPVFVSLPMDDFEQPAEVGTTELLAARRLTGRSVPARVELNALAKRLTAARNPVLVVGAGLDTAPGGFKAGVALAERQNLPVWLAPNASRVGFPTDHAHFRGSLPAGIAWLSESLAEHDLILVAGAPVFQYYPYAPGSYLRPGAELIAIADDPDAAARAPLGDAVVADPALALQGLLELLPQTNRPRPPLRAPLEIPPAVDTLTASQVYDIVGPLFGHNGIVVTESMNGAAAMWDRMRFRRSVRSSSAPQAASGSPSRVRWVPSSPNPSGRCWRSAATAAHSTASKACTPRPTAAFRSRSWSSSTVSTESSKASATTSPPPVCRAWTSTTSTTKHWRRATASPRCEPGGPTNWPLP